MYRNNCYCKLKKEILNEIKNLLNESAAQDSQLITQINTISNNLTNNTENDNKLKLRVDILEKILANQQHEYVDLGLPSGTKWATMNIGATSETDYGLYFAWGDTQGYTADQVGSGEGQKAFTLVDYKLTEDEGSTMSKYNATDGKTILDIEDDAVVANWGGDWHMPTEEQFRELLNTTYVTNTWVTDYNGSSVNGRLFTSVSNGNTLFIPAAGNAYNSSVQDVGNDGYLWSSSLFSSSVKQGRGLYLRSYYVQVENIYRYHGHSVRGVIG